ncbi:uncharacterized protein DNG_07509 [Cephalotrichum gorgonifer]|uniref:Uncharacterized protein n=1 Tax=Cephalotrichum gorgonifer TaxID=2041049 RepID=A0AAE8N3J4_9PEZI|nr:uncharacterized protein DNG_07509 [Cephalotrichum gorgonifer]
MPSQRVEADSVETEGVEAAPRRMRCKRKAETVSVDTKDGGGTSEDDEDDCTEEERTTTQACLTATRVQLIPITAEGRVVMKTETSNLVLRRAMRELMNTVPMMMPTTSTTPTRSAKRTANTKEVEVIPSTTPI